MPPTDIATAANAQLVQTVEYGIDRRGWGMFGRLSGVLQRAHTGRVGVRVVERGAAFTGYAQSPQRFTGVGQLLGGGRPVTLRTSQLVDERSTPAIDDPAMRVFSDRTRRRR